MSKSWMGCCRSYQQGMVTLKLTLVHSSRLWRMLQWLTGSRKSSPQDMVTRMSTLLDNESQCCKSEWCKRFCRNFLLGILSARLILQCSIRQDRTA